MPILGVIGGSGVYDIPELRLSPSVLVDTPFGRPSGPIARGQVGETELLFLARHGRGHVFSPTTVPYRANIYALKELGATHVLSLSAVGSLREELPPRTRVVPDQIIDRTVHRDQSFFEQGVVAHVGIADPFCRQLQHALEKAAAEAGRPVRSGGSYVCIEGPQFSTRAESNLYRSWGATVIGMTAMPEARLAREAELCYAMLALVTDYDVWHDTEADVSIEVVSANLQANREAASLILTILAQRGLPERTCRCEFALDHAIMTDPDQITPEALDRVRLLIGNRLGST
jgi:5'-methylthioadenosine phosphorylase